jgi:hypothetical protein
MGLMRMPSPRPFQYRGLFLVPFSTEGQMTASGISVVHDKRLPKIYGRVTAVHSSCRTVRVGDWVVFERERPVRLPYPGGQVWSLDERQVLGVVQAPDGLPWFTEEAA